jgi:hypothetical protein
MSKATTKKFSGMSWLVVASLAATLAAYGCSSNQYAGNGQPTAVTPTINSVNHSMTTGSSYGTEGTPPMASSYVNPSARAVNVDALAILAAEQGFRGRVLGPVNPDGSLAGVTVASGQFVSPAQQVYPQSTVNSSINSQPTPVITGGDIAVTTASNGTTAAATPVATTAATTAAATTPTTVATGALTTSTGASRVAGSAVFSPALMNSTPAPQATGTTNRTLPTLVATGRANPTTASTSRSTSTTSASRMSTANVNVVSGIQIQTNANGGIMMTNVVNTAPTVKGK